MSLKNFWWMGLLLQMHFTWTSLLASAYNSTIHNIPHTREQDKTIKIIHSFIIIHANLSVPVHQPPKLVWNKILNWKLRKKGMPVASAQVSSSSSNHVLVHAGIRFNFTDYSGQARAGSRSRRLLLGEAPNISLLDICSGPQHCVAMSPAAVITWIRTRAVNEPSLQRIY